MRQQQWEDQVRETLNEYTSQSKGDWKAFSEKLDFERFDEKVRSKLIDHQASNYESHWKRIQVEMLMRKKVSRKIVQVKFFELLVLVFLLQGLYIALPFDRIPTDENTPVTNAKSYLPLAAVTESDKSTDYQGLINDKNNLNKQSKSQTQIPKKLSKKTLYNNDLTSSASYSQKSNVLPLSIDQASGILTTRIKKSLGTEKTNSNHSIVNQSRHKINVERIPLLASNVEYKNEHLASGKIVVLSHRNKKHSIGMYAGISNADVNSPYDPLYFRKGYKTNGSALRYGINYGYTLGKWIIKAGVEYLHMRYLPIPQYETPQPSLVQNEAPIRVGLSEFKYQQLSLPLSIQREFSLGGSSVLSLNAGVNPSINLYSTYLLEYKSSNETVRRVAVDNTYVNTSHLNGVGIQEKEFDTGIVYGGAWRRNLSLYSTTSIGYHHHLPMDIRMNITGYYCHPLYDFRLGPNRDKVNLFGMTLGMSKYF